MIEFETKVRVRYAETDQMGYLHHSNYVTYYEVGRIEMLRWLGLSYGSMEKEYGVIMPVTSLEMRYVRPAFFEDLLTVKVKVKELPRKYFVFEVDIYNEEQKLVNRGKVRLAFVPLSGGSAMNAPEFLLEKLEPFFA